MGKPAWVTVSYISPEGRGSRPKSQSPVRSGSMLGPMNVQREKELLRDFVADLSKAQEVVAAAQEAQQTVSELEPIVQRLRARIARIEGSPLDAPSELLAKPDDHTFELPRVTTKQKRPGVRQVIE